MSNAIVNRTRLGVGAILSAALISAGAEAPAVKRPELVVAPRLPVVNTKVKLRLYEVPSGTVSGELTIVGPEDRVALQEKVATEDGELLTWVPEQTGYYAISLVTDDGRTLRVERVPVVWRKLTFMSWFPLAPADSERFPLLTSTVITSPAHFEEWQRLGSVTYGTAYYRRSQMLKLNQPEEQIVEGLVKRWAKQLDAGADGVWIDELGAYPHQEHLPAVKLEMKALKALRDRYPDKLLASAVGGAPLREYAAGHKLADALITSETYLEYHSMVHGSHSPERHIDVRVNVMRDTDLIFERGYSRKDTQPDQWRRHGGILLLSPNLIGGGLWEEPAKPRIEHYVRYIKKTAPEMPGIGFYGGQWSAYMKDLGVIDAAEKFCEKYYVRPVVDIRDVFLTSYEPQVGEALPIHVSLHNVGGMDARGIVLRLRVVVPDLATQTVGEQLVDHLGTGFASIEAGGGKIALVEKQGNLYTIPPGHPHVAFLARRTLTFEWTPSAPGPCRILVDVVPNDDAFTLLTGHAEADVWVR